ncbi:hypothetical protein P4G62_23465, partial [Bacillus cereus]|nr:hypothetical protein [Bacillus cereus]
MSSFLMLFIVLLQKSLSSICVNEGAIAPANRWEMNVGWRKPTCLLLYTCTDRSLKTEDIRLVAERR